MKCKKIWFVMIGCFVLSVLGGMMLLQKEAIAATDYTIWAEASTLTYEQKDYDIPLAASKLLVFASDSEGNMLTDDKITITNIEKKNVCIDRITGQYGKKSYVGTEDITSKYANADMIEDANGIYTITYAVNGGSQSVKVVVQAGDFSAPEIYKDREGNDATADTSSKVNSGTTVSYSVDGIAGYMKAGDRSEVTFDSFDVWDDGTKTVTGGTDGDFTVGTYGSYKVHVTATDSNGNMTKFPMVIQSKYLAREDFESRANGTPTTWASQDTLLVQHYDSLQIITTGDDNKQLKIESASSQWPHGASINGVQYSGFGCNYGFGLFDLPITTEHEYKATFDVSIQATYSDAAAGKTVYIGYPNGDDYWATVTLDENGTYTGEVTIPKAMIAPLGNVGGEPYYSAATAMVWFMFDKATGTNAVVTIDNMQLIPLVSEKNAIISSLETSKVSVGTNEVFSLLPESYGLEATDFRGLDLASIDLEVKEGEPETAVTVDIADGVTELSSDKNTYYQLIYTLTDYYGNTKVETVGVSVGGIEYNAPVINADDTIALAKDTSVSFEATPNKYFSVEEESAYTLKYTVEKNGVVEVTDADSYSFTMTDTDTYKVTITATDAWNASTSKAIVFNYAGAYVYNFEEREVGTTPSWAGENTLLIQHYQSAKIISEDDNKKLKIESPKTLTSGSDGWPKAQILEGSRYDGIVINCGLGLFDLPLDTNRSYRAVMDVTMQATYSTTAEGESVYIGYPFAENSYNTNNWAKVSLDASGAYTGQIEIPQVKIASLGTAGNTPYYASATAQIYFLFKNETGTNANITIDNIRLIPVIENEQTLTTGESVTFDSEGKAVGINANGYETFTYTVEKNGEVVATDVASYTIDSMTATDYYEVWANATDKYGNTESRYMLFVGKSVNLNTFSALTTSNLNWQYGFVMHYNGDDLTKAGTAEIYTDASGNKKLQFVVSETDGLKTGLDFYLPYNRFNFGTALDTALTSDQYDMYVDLEVKVKLKDGVTLPTMSMGGVTFTLSEEKDADGWYTYSGTLKDCFDRLDSGISAFHTPINISDCTSITDLVVEIDNIRWVALQ